MAVHEYQTEVIMITGGGCRVTGLVLEADPQAATRASWRLAAARPPCERALAIREKVLGPEHPDTSRSRRALGPLPPPRSG